MTTMKAYLLSFSGAEDDELRDPHAAWFLAYPCDDAPLIFDPDDAAEFSDIVKYLLEKGRTLDYARAGALIGVGFGDGEDGRAFYNAFRNVAYTSYYDALDLGYAAIADLHADDESCSDDAEKAKIMQLLDAELEGLS